MFSEVPDCETSAVLPRKKGSKTRDISEPYHSKEEAAPITASQTDEEIEEIH